MLSVIIPVLNEERTLSKLLECLSRQKGLGFEVIVVDAGSMDKTVDVARSFEQRLNLRIVQLGRVGRGISKQRNAGARAAKGGLFLFIDADMWFDDDFLQRLLSSFERSEGDAAIIKIKPLRELANVMDRIVYALTNFFVFNLGIGGKGNCVLIRRDSFWKVGGFDENVWIAEDSVFFDSLRASKAKLCRFNIVAYEDPRRFHEKGYVRSALKYVLNYLWARLFKKSLSTGWRAWALRR